MAILCRFKLMTCVQFSVQDKSAAHACANKKSNNILIATSSTVFILSEDAQIDIIAYIEWNSESFFHSSFEIVISPWKIRRKQYNAICLIYHTRRTGSDCMNLILFYAGFFHHFFDYACYDFFNVLRGIPFCFRSFF